jgi:hypothetical protein
MAANPTNKGIIAKNFTGIGTVTLEMIRERAHELAILSGRVPAHVTQAESEQARRELSGGSDLDGREEVIEAIPESGRWDPVPGSAGRQIPESLDDDEDDEGRNGSAQLVEDGVQEAEHDQMLQAEQSAQEIRKRDQVDR